MNKKICEKSLFNILFYRKHKAFFKGNEKSYMNMYINNSYYDNTYKFNFNIYYINDNLLLINEKNLINNNIKFYWLSTNLNNFSKLIFE